MCPDTWKYLLYLLKQQIYLIFLCQHIHYFEYFDAITVAVRFAVSTELPPTITEWLYYQKINESKN